MSRFEQILIVDDDERYCQRISETLERRQNLLVDWITEPDALDQTLDKKEYVLILLDLMFDGEWKGLEILENLKERPDCPSVVVVTSSSDTRHAVKAIKLGALDYLEKHPDYDRLTVTIKNAIHASRVSSENRRLRQSIKAANLIVGEHQRIKTMMDEIRRAADSDEVVLITGETGVGKELVARAIHAESERVSQSFFPVNCASIPEGMVESELFGHVKGAFSGALSDRKGAFLAAGEGVLFLDEIGEMPPAVQAKLLRVLGDRKVKKVGSDQDVPYRARVIAATNRDPKKLIREGKFREDLYFRLNVIPIQTPSLRERLEDIPRLFRYFVEDEFSRNNLELPLVDDAVLGVLLEYDWPGNVRELQVLAKRLALSYKGGLITTDDIAQQLPGTSQNDQTGDTFQKTRERAEKDLLERLIIQYKGNVKEIAAHLGRTIWTVYKKAEKYNLPLSPKLDCEQTEPAE